MKLLFFRCKPQTNQQAGQVWYPDSSYKTAQAIRDFNREQLPLFILANWRGFSGGMRDMYEQVLKFGSYIVDALREYRQPVYVYLPPHAELRGGAWAVLDSLINPRRMEMYADPEARGGVLEPEGIVEVRYKDKDLVKTVQRLDPVVRELKLRQQQCADADVGTVAAAAAVQQSLELEVRERIAVVLPMYHSVAVRFAELHDGPVRMLAKRCINGIVPWRRAREVFYWKLLRRLRQDVWATRVAAAAAIGGVSKLGQANGQLRQWFVESLGLTMVRFATVCPVDIFR